LTQTVRYRSLPAKVQRRPQLRRLQMNRALGWHAVIASIFLQEESY
jgi:hypothetical protein